MNWYKFHSFTERLESIEQFFIEIAANEELLALNGFASALSFPNAESAMSGLATFHDDIAALRRYLAVLDKPLSLELNRLESEGRLVEQVSLIFLQLRMAAAKKPISASISTVNRLVAYLPYISKMAKTKSLFGEETIAIQKTIINLASLHGIAQTFSDMLRNRETLDDEVFKPSNVDAGRVIGLIDQALTEIGHLTSLSPTERLLIEGYLDEAKKEAISESPSWSKIIGALVIVAAITSGLADAPGAAKTIKDAIEYILGSSVEKPLQRYLPPPVKQQGEEREFNQIA